MNAHWLLTHFDRLEQAPDAIARLRRFILDLAIRGKLVEQRSDEGNTDAFLEQIQFEKQRMRAANEIKKQKELSGTKGSEDVFPIPKGWCWSRLAEVGFINPRNICKDETAASFVPMAKISAAYGVPVLHEVRQWGAIKQGFTHFAEGDVGLAKITPCFENGKSTVFRNLTGGVGAGTTELHILRPVLVSADYLLIFLKSPFFISGGIPHMTGTAGQKRVATDYFTNAPLPLPTLAEQLRIVAKVHDLMGLCDQLEAARIHRDGRRKALSSATYYRLTEEASAAEYAQQFNFLLVQLESLSERTEQIPALRQTILNLAIKGCLVPQNVTDEPAQKLLEKIKIREEELVSEGTIKRQKRPIPIVRAEEPFAAPHQWEWVRLSSIADVQDPNPSHRMPRYVNSDGVPFISSENFVAGDSINFSIGKQVSKETLQEQVGRFSILDGALAFTRIGTIGKSRFLPTKRNFALSHAVCVINPLDPSALNMKFLRIALQVESILAFAHRGTRSIGVPDLGMAVIRNMAIPLPPLLEQQRIVEKVDLMFALCNELEQALGELRDDQGSLLQASFRVALSLDQV